MICRKKTACLLLAAIFTLGSSAPCFAALKIVQGEELSTKIGDPPNGAISKTEPGTEIEFSEYDPVSGLIPIYRDVPPSLLGEDKESKLLFINLSGEIVIQPNINWTLISGFSDGCALIQERDTHTLIYINEKGEEVSRFNEDQTIFRPALLSSASPFSHMYIHGSNGSKYRFSPKNLSAIFINSKGERKEVTLQGKYWRIGDFQENGYAPLFKKIGEQIMTVDYTHETFPYYQLKQEDYMDENGVIHSGPMPGYQENEKKSNDNNTTRLPYDNEKNAYIGSCYEVRKNPNPGWNDYYFEIYDKEGNPTGVKLYSLVGGGDNFVLGRAYDQNLAPNFVYPYCFYYINEE